MNRTRLISWLIAPWLCLTMTAQAERAPGGFDRLKTLIGEWHGTLPDGKPIRISYREISGGAIVEVYHSTDPMWWNMSSVYHAGDGEVIMSHYCSWGNHPRMKATSRAGDSNTLAFEYWDMTQTAPEHGYMRELTVEFKDEDHLYHHWVWREDGNNTPLTLELERRAR